MPPQSFPRTDASPRNPAAYARLPVARGRLSHPCTIGSASRDSLDDFATFHDPGDTRPMFQIFPLLHATLPLIELEGRRFLLDTGATQSVGTVPPATSPVGRCLTTPQALPITQMVWPAVQQAVRHLGYDGPLDALVGVDRLAALDLVIDVSNGFIALRPAEQGATSDDVDATRVASTLLHGIPCVRLRFGEKVWQAALDTGASLGYFVGPPPVTAVPGPVHVDHHPLVGAFTAPTFTDAMTLGCADNVDLDLGDQRMGRISGMLGAMLEMAGLDAAVGGAVFSSRAVRLTDGLGRVDVLGAAVHDTLGRDYEAMFDDLYGPAVLARHGSGLAEAAAAMGVHRVLDVGAGAGTVSRALRARGFSVVAVEPSRTLAGVLAGELARGENPVDVYLGKAEDLSTLAIAPVDMTFFAFGVVDYLLDDEALLRALAGAYALTRDGGRCWVQPAPRAFFQSASQVGTRYRRDVHVTADADGETVRCDHRVFIDGALVSEEAICFRPRTLVEVRVVAERAGWSYEGTDKTGIYPTLRLIRTA